MKALLLVALSLAPLACAEDPAPVAQPFATQETLDIDMSPSLGAGAPASGGRRPSIRVGATTVTGRLPPEVVQRILRQGFGHLRDCYKTGLLGRPGLGGRMLIRFPISPDGVVGIIDTEGSDLSDKSTFNCVAQVFRALSFPRPETGQVDVVYPLVFDPGEAPK